MKTNTLALLLTGVMFFLFIGAIGAQDLFDNDFMRRAIDARQQAAQALDAGDYALSIELSKQAQELQRLARVEAERLYNIFRARAFKRRAEDALDAVDRSNAITSELAVVVEDARVFYREGVLFFDDQDYRLSTLSFRNVLSTLEGGGLWPEDALRTLLPAVSLPEYYRVRLIPEDRDSFSKIAGYDFVYNDIMKWPELYNANKEIIVDSENPDLIHPGQLFIIPSLSGERRDGEWDPDDE